MTFPRLSPSHLRAVALAALLVAPALAAQTPEPVRWVAEAERLQEADAPAALALLRRALPRLTAPGDVQPRLKALQLRCWTAADAAPDSVLAFGESGLAEARRHGDAEAVTSLGVCRGYGLELAGRTAEALAEYDRGAAEGRRLGARDVTASTLLLRGQLHYQRADYTGALQDLDEAYRVFAALGNRAQGRNALNAIANLYADRNVAQYDRALEYYRQVLAANHAAGSRQGVATAHYNVANTLEKLGRLDEALGQYRRGLELDVARGDSAEAATDRRAIGIVLYKMGRPAEALAVFDQVRAYAERAGDADLAAQTRLSRGVALRMLGRNGESLAELERARVYFEAAESPRFLEKVHEERSLAYAGLGGWRDAFRARGEQMALHSRFDNAASQERNSRLRVQFDADKKEAENRTLLRENELRREALAAAARVRRLQVGVIALGALAIGALILLAVRQVANARLLREAALTDELTRLPNRRHLYLLADTAARVARSRSVGFSVLALDVDHFKRINDRLGHEAGDVVLRRVAEVARAALREGDHLGRTGGEEFVAVLPGAEDAAAYSVAERVRAAVEHADFRDVDPGLRVTVSVGVAVWSPADDGFPSICRRADESLYSAKSAGRNRVEMAAA